MPATATSRSRARREDHSHRLAARARSSPGASRATASSGRAGAAGARRDARARRGRRRRRCDGSHVGRGAAAVAAEASHVAPGPTQARGVRPDTGSDSALIGRSQRGAVGDRPGDRLDRTRELRGSAARPLRRPRRDGAPDERAVARGELGVEGVEHRVSDARHPLSGATLRAPARGGPARVGSANPGRTLSVPNPLHARRVVRR